MPFKQIDAGADSGTSGIMDKIIQRYNEEQIPIKEIEHKEDGSEPEVTTSTAVLKRETPLVKYDIANNGVVSDGTIKTGNFYLAKAVVNTLLDAIADTERNKILWDFFLNLETIIKGLQDEIKTLNDGMKALSKLVPIPAGPAAGCVQGVPGAAASGIISPGTVDNNISKLNSDYLSKTSIIQTGNTP